jgi:hypothetical protein
LYVAVGKHLGLVQSTRGQDESVVLKIS